MTSMSNNEKIASILNVSYSKKVQLERYDQEVIWAVIDWENMAHKGVLFAIKLIKFLPFFSPTFSLFKLMFMALSGWVVLHLLLSFFFTHIQILLW